MGLSAAPSLRLGFTGALKRKRSLIDLAADQITQGTSAEKIALSVAVGSLCAFFPILGAATPICLLAGAALRLNQPIVQIVNWGTAPAYLPLVYGFIRAGDFILGTSRAHLDAKLILHQFGSLAGHALLGWAVLAPFWVLAAYYISLPVLRAVMAARRMPKS